MTPETCIEVDELAGAVAPDWAERVLQSPLFQLLPAASLQRVFDALERVPLTAGQTLVGQGEHSGYYYIVAEGQASISRELAGNGRRLSLGMPGPGDAFGHVPLITGEVWSARVRWKRDGAVMRLPASVFRSAICAAVLHGVTPQEARVERAAGAVWVDVREPSAYRLAHLDDALNLPLALLPWLCPRLSCQQTYLAYAETPAVAAAAAFQLLAAGHRASFLAAPWQSLSPRVLPDASTALPAELEALIAGRVQAREAVLRQTFASAWARREKALHAAYARVLAEVSSAGVRGGSQESARTLLRQAERGGITA